MNSAEFPEQERRDSLDLVGRERTLLEIQIMMLYAMSLNKARRELSYSEAIILSENIARLSREISTNDPEFQVPGGNIGHTIVGAFQSVYESGKLDELSERFGTRIFDDLNGCEEPEEKTSTKIISDNAPSNYDLALQNWIELNRV